MDASPAESGLLGPRRAAAGTPLVSVNRSTLPGMTLPLLPSLPSLPVDLLPGSVGGHLPAGGSGLTGFDALATAAALYARLIASSSASPMAGLGLGSAGLALGRQSLSATVPTLTGAPSSETAAAALAFSRFAASMATAAATAAAASASSNSTPPPLTLPQQLLAPTTTASTSTTMSKFLVTSGAAFSAASLPLPRGAGVMASQSLLLSPPPPPQPSSSFCSAGDTNNSCLMSPGFGSRQAEAVAMLTSRSGQTSSARTAGAASLHESRAVASPRGEQTSQ
ncbi:unnamed protein product [Protopolystoma xenopodis]|uniref:Uncharacterized protein n=1 Tax=Protopolystoma xenopodis TaxID=117903 RepID=A0A3S5B1Q8_9PLAT|nr:unnamed protein product [Protopolystoma xenopodis]